MALICISTRIEERSTAWKHEKRQNFM